MKALAILLALVISAPVFAACPYLQKKKQEAEQQKQQQGTQQAQSTASSN